MTSEATVMSNPVSRGTPWALPPRPMTVWRRARSFMSMARRRVMVRGSMPRALPCCRWLSSMAARRLWAVPTAWMSPVKWRFMSSMGSTWDHPPPAAPPLTPKQGPSEGSLRHIMAFFPIFTRAWVRPMVLVVLPSPAAVGVVAVTRISRPSGRSFRVFKKRRSTLAL